MAFQLSAGVNYSEIDLTTVVPSVSTTDGAIAGVFRWGPVGQRVLIENENTLVTKFGKPTNFNAETWFTAANFLSYSNRIHISRAANTSGATVSSEFEAASASAVLVGNTVGISVGMYAYQSSNTTNVLSDLSVVAANSTTITLSAASLATGNSVLYFANPATAYSAVAIPANAFVNNLTGQIVKNDEHYTSKDGTFDSDVTYVAKYPGSLGNSLRVAVCDTTASFSSSIDTTALANLEISLGSTTGYVINVASVTVATTIANKLTIGDKVLVGNNSIGQQYMTVKSVFTAGNTVTGNVVVTFEDPYRLHTPYSSNTINRYWEFSNVVETAPGQSEYALHGNTAANDEVHVVVVDENGGFTGTPGTILEVYKGLSRIIEAKNPDNSTNYYKNVINQASDYVWFANDRPNAPSANALYVASATTTAPANYVLKFGTDGYDEANTSAFSSIASAYDLFASPEDIDLSIVLQGRPLGGSTSVAGETVTGYQLANYIIDNILETRKDCVGAVSPDKYTVINNNGNEAISLKNWSSVIRNSSYAIVDSGYKRQYDKYNDIFRWIPLNGDIAGLCARTDLTNDAWWSPAGFNRGQIKNVVKLAYNPSKAARDILYSASVNPVVTFPSEGTVLFGDKTHLSKPSAFDRINVRRLFIVLEKAISISAKYSLFQFNDAFTRAQFKNSVIPFLRTIQGRRGITDFLVVCDDTNNTAQVIDNNQFVGDIYIKPARSINFIQLNFVAVGTGVQFSEVVGKSQ